MCCSYWSNRNKTSCYEKHGYVIQITTTFIKITRISNSKLRYILLLLSTHRWNFYSLDVAAAPHSHGKSVHQLTVAIGTDVENPALRCGIVVDCGSSGSRVYVYFWPPHSGNPQELLNVQQMRDDKGELVVKKIEPGILTS